jgi:lipoprotein-anchoring transpeptidase ErfK/SrfK
MNKIYSLLVLLVVAALVVMYIVPGDATGPMGLLKPKAKFSTINLGGKDPYDELVSLIGEKNITSTLAINHIDNTHVKPNSTLVIPESYKDPSWWQFMPTKVESLQTISKLLIVSAPLQVFGAYEWGNLVYTGPVSTGKESSQTPAGLYFMNWKGEEVESSFDDEWILKWNFNIDNELGISLHEYELPGFPASHSCVRLYAADAKWMYDWGEQWTLVPDSETKLANGTPVIIYGAYDFTQNPPWTRLPTDPQAMYIKESDLNKVVRTHMSELRY